MTERQDNAGRFILCCLSLAAVWFTVGFLLGKDHRPEPVTRTVLCTHGESSAFATIDKNGKIHQSKPVVTGCVP